MNTPISQLLSEKRSDVVFVSPEDSVFETVKLMNEKRIGSVLVLVGGRLAGIFTERDILSRVVAAGIDPATTKIRDVMTANPVVVSSKISVEEAMTIINDRKVRHLPVLDGDKIEGLISAGDLNRHLTEFFKAEAGTLMNYITGDSHYGI